MSQVATTLASRGTLKTHTLTAIDVEDFIDGLRGTRAGQTHQNELRWRRTSSNGNIDRERRPVRGAPQPVADVGDLGYLGSRTPTTGRTRCARPPPCPRSAPAGGARRAADPRASRSKPMSVSSGAPGAGRGRGEQGGLRHAPTLGSRRLPCLGKRDCRASRSSGHPDLVMRRAEERTDGEETGQSVHLPDGRAPAGRRRHPIAPAEPIEAIESRRPDAEDRPGGADGGDRSR